MSSVPELSVLARQSGGLAMLAVDQREALRNMLRAQRGVECISDEELVDFKTAAVRILSPYASAVLIDHEFALDKVCSADVIDKGCALIASGDLFHPGNGIPVDRVTIDYDSTPEHAVELGARAMKLLVLWRDDEDRSERLAMVNEFVGRCHKNGLLSIIEPVVRVPRTAASFDRDAAILRAAEEMGSCGADLYKAEMPHGGVGSSDDLYSACKELDSRITMPWVILSSGVAPDLFPNAVRQAVRAGAQGFLAGRAVWSTTLGFADYMQALQDLAVPRLRRLGEIVDDAISAR